jgi:hypothetical protein
VGGEECKGAGRSEEWRVQVWDDVRVLDVTASQAITSSHILGFVSCEHQLIEGLGLVKR